MLWPIGAVSAEVDLSGRNIQHLTKFEKTEIAEDRFIAMVESAGVTIHSTGEVTTNKLWGYVDRASQGDELHRGYFRRTWPDGTTTTERYESHPVLGEGETQLIRGKFEYLGGTGRFDGISGGGEFEGRVCGNGMLVVDWTSTMIDPSQ